MFEIEFHTKKSASAYVYLPLSGPGGEGIDICAPGLSCTKFNFEQLLFNVFFWCDAYWRRGPDWIYLPSKKSRNLYHTFINISILLLPKIVMLTNSFFHDKMFMFDRPVILENRMKFCIAFWQWRWFSVMGSPGCAYTGGKVYRRVAVMDGNQNEFFHWILTAVMFQCYGFTGVCIRQGKCLWKGGKEGWVPGWVFPLDFKGYDGSVLMGEGILRDVCRWWDNGPWVFCHVPILEGKIRALKNTEPHHECVIGGIHWSEKT